MGCKLNMPCRNNSKDALHCIRNSLVLPIETRLRFYWFSLILRFLDLSHTPESRRRRSVFLPLDAQEIAVHGFLQIVEIILQQSNITLHGTK